MLLLLGLGFLLWPRPSLRSPYPRSDYITGITWNFSYPRLAPGSDLWPVTWAVDDNMYCIWGDGGGFGGTNKLGRVSLGVGRISQYPGNYPDNVANVMGGYNPEGGNQAQFGGKSNAILSVNGTLYAIVGVAPGVKGISTYGGVHENRLMWSDDFGKTWQYANWTYADAQTPDLTPVSFINFGRDYAGARDNYVYLLGNVPYWSPLADSSYSTYLIRVPRDQLKRQNSYEYFAGFDVSDNPTWSSNKNAKSPIFTGRAGRLGEVFYNIPLKRYIGVAAKSIGEVAFYEASEPWGPWRLIEKYSNLNNLGATEYLGYHVLPKWTSADGRTVWFCYSSTGELDSFNLAKATFTLVSAMNSP